MHLKSTSEQAKQPHSSSTNGTSSSKTMASSTNDNDDNRSRVSNSNSNNTTTTSNNNNNSNEDSNSTNNTPLDEAEIKLKKQTLEQRRQELEKLLTEKNWLLQQIQKQETQILNGNYEYLNLNEVFANLKEQYRQEQQQQQTLSHSTTGTISTIGSGVDIVGGSCGGGSVGGTAILRRKATVSCKENQNIINNNYNCNNSNSAHRQSEISNRSSEYDNYPSSSGNGETTSSAGVAVGGSVATQQVPAKQAMKKRATPTPSVANLSFMQLQRQQLLQQHVEQQMLQQHLQYAAYQQQQQQQQRLLQHTHYHQQQQQQQSPQHPKQIDAISLYSVNSANVATLRQQPLLVPQQPIVVQCDKYYLSPTHQSYSEGGFIRSSQNIKKYISPLSSPTTTQQQLHSSPAVAADMQAHQQNLLHAHAHQRHQLDAISLAPSYVSMDAAAAQQNLRWRSQTNITHGNAHAHAHAQDAKSHSSDMLAQLSSAGAIYNPHHAALQLKPKPLDEISISSLNSETNKKTKPKQWLESSLDGPVIRSPAAEPYPHDMNTSPATPTIRATQKTHTGARERTKLSSQSMSSARHYSMSAAKSPHNAAKLLQDDDGRYAKLSQSTSYLNSLDTNMLTPAAYQLDAAAPHEIPPFNYLPPKPHANNAQPTPPPRPPPATIAPAAMSPPDIRIESPKNMTIVQQATFQPYKEVTKPFEMSDFYKYSTKFRQKEPANADANAN